MPSGPKRRKAAAAKKKKEQGSSIIGSTATTATNNGDEDLKTQDSDGGELGTPASNDYRKEQHPFGKEGVKESPLVGSAVPEDVLTKEVVEIGEALQKPIGSEDEGIEIARELRQEESGKGDTALETGRNDGSHSRSSSNSSSSSSSEDESQDAKKTPNLELKGPPEVEAEKIPTALDLERRPKEEAEKIPTALELEKQPEEEAEKIPTALELEKQTEEVAEKIPIVLELEKPPDEESENVPVVLELEKPEEESMDLVEEVHWVLEADLVEEVDSVQEADFVQEVDSVQKADLASNKVLQVEEISPAVEAHNYSVETEHVIDTIEPTMIVPENIVQVSESDTLESSVNDKEAKYESKEKEETKPLSTVANYFESKESEDDVLPLSNANYGESSCGIDAAKGTEDKLLLSSTAKSRETGNGMEHVKDSDAESQSLRAVAPRVVQTSWKGCCGLFELLTGSRE